MQNAPAGCDNRRDKIQSFRIATNEEAEEKRSYDFVILR